MADPKIAKGHEKHSDRNEGQHQEENAMSQVQKKRRVGKIWFVEEQSSMRSRNRLS